MFFKLILRNSKRNRKENGLFFSSLLASIIAFYIILSLPYQDVMIFLAQMESDAVDRLLTMIPAFFGMTLFILFFLIYYASKFQLERRRHELGVCLILGMRRFRLFAMLLAEDLQNSAVTLIIGLPAAMLLSELISLITARLVGLGIVGHQLSFSLKAALWTAAGFLLIKSAAFFILSAKLSREEIGSLLADTPDAAKKRLPDFFYLLSLLAGILCLAAAYSMAIRGEAWSGPLMMCLTALLGTLGTMTLFWGFGFLTGAVVKSPKKNRQLHIFNFRQIEETVIRRSSTLAVCSLLILAALCCFGAGTGICRFYNEAGQHVLDYTFENSENSADTAAIRQTLRQFRLDTQFSELFEMKTGRIRTAEDTENAFQMEPFIAALNELPPSKARNLLIGNFEYETDADLISKSSYDKLLAAAGLPKLELAADEAAVYMSHDFITGERADVLSAALAARPHVWLDGKKFYLAQALQTLNLVTDRSITLYFALILPDEAFEYYTQGEYEVYLNGILEKGALGSTSLMSAISDMNQKLDETGLHYESYLQNMGRQLFYMVAASYITIYLAVIFLIIANTVIGVQFLISQQKSNRRYRTLIHLGAGYPALCKSARKQINWYFGIPAATAAISSLFGVRALLTGILPSAVRSSLSDIMILSAAMILLLCVIEYIYIAVVKRTSDHYLLTLMVPEREE